VPIFGPLTMAGFADIGTAFNLKKGGTQAINSSFLRDDLFLGSSNINTLIFLYRNDSFLTAGGSYFLRNGSLLSTTQYVTDYCTLDTNGDGVFNECPTTLPTDVSEVFLRGNAQTNTRVNIGSSAFSKIGNFRATVGIEMRVQVPIVNVPFRLIYYYNPNIKIGFNDEAPGLFLPGKRSGLRFTVGRTF
jgi:outer membrane protein insertion porin family